MSRHQLSVKYRADKAHNVLPRYKTSSTDRKQVCKYTRTRQYLGKQRAKQGSLANFDETKRRAGVRLQAAWRGRKVRKHAIARKAARTLTSQIIQRVLSDDRESRARAKISAAVVGRRARHGVAAKRLTRGIFQRVVLASRSEGAAVKGIPVTLLPVPAGPPLTLPNNARNPVLDLRGALQTFSSSTSTQADDLIQRGVTPRRMELGGFPYNQEEIRRALSVRSSQWFGTGLLDGWASLLQPAAQRQGILLLGAAVSTQWLRPEDQATTIRSLYGKHSLRWHDKGRLIRGVVLVINVHGNHWIVLFYDRHTNTIYTMDSFDENHNTEVGRFRDMLQAVYLAPRDVSVSKVNLPRQHDGFECGAWASLYMACIACRRHLPTDATTNLRRLLACLLCSWQGGTEASYAAYVRRHLGMLW